MSGKSALIIGATGATGKHVLRELIASSHFTRVGEFGRRVTAQERLAPGHEGKLLQKAIDFEKLEESGLKEGKWDVVFITLGTTRAQAGSAAAFEKIDREYVINAAKAAKTDEPGHDQRVVYISSNGSSPNSLFLYPRSKAATEDGLAGLGYNDVIILRPGLIESPHRENERVWERVAEVFTKSLSFVSSGLGIDAAVLGKSMVHAGIKGTSGLPTSVEPDRVSRNGVTFTSISNKGCINLANDNA